MEQKSRPASYNIAHGDVFHDYQNRMELDPNGVDYEDVAHGYKIKPLPTWKPQPKPDANEAHTKDKLGDLLETFGAEVLREVLAELKTEEVVGVA